MRTYANADALTCACRPLQAPLLQVVLGGVLGQQGRRTGPSCNGQQVPGGCVNEVLSAAFVSLLGLVMPRCSGIVSLYMPSPQNPSCLNTHAPSARRQVPRGRAAVCGSLPRLSGHGGEVDPLWSQELRGRQQGEGRSSRFIDVWN